MAGAEDVSPVAFPSLWHLLLGCNFTDLIVMLSYGDDACMPAPDNWTVAPCSSPYALCFTSSVVFISSHPSPMCVSDHVCTGSCVSRCICNGCVGVRGQPGVPFFRGTIHLSFGDSFSPSLSLIQLDAPACFAPQH